MNDSSVALSSGCGGESAVIYLLAVSMIEAWCTQSMAFHCLLLFADMQLHIKIDALADSMGNSRVKRSDNPLHQLVTYCYRNCCSYDQLDNICRGRG